MIRIGTVGVGFMGMIHFLAAKKLSNAKVTAIATRNPKKRAGDWSMIQGNFGPRGGQEDLSGIATYENAQQLIADPEIDLVDVCLPNDQHCDVVIEALKAGKHVLVEKAIALSLDEADRMLAAAKQAGKLLMVAHVLPFFPDFAQVVSAVQSSEHGKLLAAHFRRHISPPDWSSDMKDADKTGGPIIDLHIHDTHFVGLIAGVPKGVCSRGVINSGSVDYVSTQYLYDDPVPVITAASGSLSQPSRPFTHGYEVYFEKATFMYEAGGPLTVYTPDGAETPDLSGGDEIDAFAAELQTAVDAVQTGDEPKLLSGELARNALALCLKEAESVLAGGPVEVA